MDVFFRQTIACSAAVSIGYKNLMGRYLKSDLVTIYNGGFLQETVPSVDEKKRAREILGISDKKFVVAHIGRMTGHGRGGKSNLKFGQKAHDVLIKAFAKAFSDDPDSALILVGDGPLQTEVKALAGDLGIFSKTHFLGQVAEPWEALKAADMFCFPSRHEGLPNALVEAASCGLPVVASNIQEIRDLYQGNAWKLVAVDDITQFSMAMQDIRKNKDEYLIFAQEAAKDFQDRFSMVNCAMNYLKAYKSLLN